MRELFEELKIYLRENNIDGLFFNSSNEFLMEYNIPELNSAFKLTGFSGSTSMGVVTKEKVFLLVDTRYHAQADIEVKDDFVEIVKVPLGLTLPKALFKLLPKNFKLGVPAKKISKALLEYFSLLSVKRKIEILLFDSDGIELCSESSDFIQDYEIFPVSPEISGKTADEKISSLIKRYKGNSLIITDLSDIAYFTNLRSFDFPYSSSFPSKLIINSDGGVLYVNNELNINSKLLKVKYFNEFYNDLPLIKNSVVYYQNSAISMYDYILIDKSNKKSKAVFSKIKTRKNRSEIEHLKKCFYSTDRALETIENMLNSDKEYSEFDYYRALTANLFVYGALGLSFKTIVACGDNSAIIHYSTPSKEKIVKDGDFLLIDYGAYFEGGYATDTTRTFVKGNPNKEQKKVYTTVLKAFLNAYNRSSKQYYYIDKKARDIINKELGSQYPFSHGTGHGVGINVHENPPSVSKSNLSKIKLFKNSVFSIEPGAYKLGFGGVRLENTVYAANINGKLRPQTLSKYKFEDKLVDRKLLTDKELKWYKKWQEEYERTYLSE